MSWKHVMFKCSTQPSLVRKLTGLYSLATLALLIASGFILYPTLHRLLSNYADPRVTLACYTRFILVFLFAGISALILGNWIAKKGLAKIDELKRKMEAISAHALDERIELTSWPKELKPLGACFNHMLDRLELSFSQLEQFSSDIAHEIRHPIHNLKQIAEMELRRPRLDPKIKTLCLNYTRELHHLSKLTEQLLFLARADNKQMTLKKETISLRSLVEKLFDFYCLLAEEKSIAFACEGEALLSVDPTLFQRLLNNLIMNAIQYSPPQSTIFIKIENSHSNKIQLLIQDQGIGIPLHHLDRLCDRFYRVDMARPSQTGLGLGLSIVKSIVDLHEGVIYFDSQPQQGTSVYLQFPS